MAITKTGIWVDTSNSFTNPLIYEENGQVSSIVADNLTSNTFYYVKGYIISDGVTIYSDNTRTFSTSEPDYLTFYNNDVSDVLLMLKKNGTPHDVVLEYSTDGINWVTWRSAIGDLSVRLAQGDKVLFRGDNNSFCEADQGYYNFSADGLVNCSGNVMTLVDSTGTSLQIPCVGCFYGLFMNMLTMENTGIKVPATTLTRECYHSMFDGCMMMTESPELPATTVTQRCYEAMFAGCESMTTASTIWATASAANSFEAMFKGCISLASISIKAQTWDTLNSSSWVDGVSHTGEMNISTQITVGNASGNIPQNSVDGIPTGWQYHKVL